MLYQRILVSDQSHVGEPAELPVELVGLDDATLANLPAALDPEAVQQLGYTDTGFVPYVPPPPPPPTRWSVRKSTVVQRLIEAGKITEAMQAIMSDAGSFGLWTAPDWPEVYNDDARVIAMLSAIGADPAVILAQDPTS
jgi:hypothetical protein